MCGGCGLGSAKSWSSPQCNGCYDVFRMFLHIPVTWCFGSCRCETHCSGCMSVTGGLVVGRKPVLRACFVVQSSTGTCFVQAL